MQVMGTTISGTYSGADHAIFEGLRARNMLAGITDAALPNPWRLLFLLGTVRPDKRSWYDAWQHQMLKSPSAFRVRSRSLDQRLRTALAGYDVVLHLGGLYAPFVGAWPVPVGLFCDYTTRLAELNHAPWFGMSGRKAKVWYELETELYQECSVLFTASENTRASLIQHYGVAPSSVLVVGEGVHEVHEYPRRTSDEQIVLFVGIDFDRKGGRTLLRAFSKVTSRLPGARLRVVGPPPGPTQQGVEWLGHVADRHRIHTLFSQATVFAMPSFCEPFGLVLIEAMSHGLPVLGSTADAMGEIVEEGKTGFLVPKGDAEALAERLVQLLESPALCASMGEAGRRRVQERFLWRHVVSRIEGGLREIT